MTGPFQTCSCLTPRRQEEKGFFFKFKTKKRIQSHVGLKKYVDFNDVLTTHVAQTLSLLSLQTYLIICSLRVKGIDCLIDEPEMCS